ASVICAIRSSCCRWWAIIHVAPPATVAHSPAIAVMRPDQLIRNVQALSERVPEAADSFGILDPPFHQIRPLRSVQTGKEFTVKSGHHSAGKPIAQRRNPLDFSSCTGHDVLSITDANLFPGHPFSRKRLS